MNSAVYPWHFTDLTGIAMLPKWRKSRRLKKHIQIAQKVHCNEVQFLLNAFFVVIGLDVWLAQMHTHTTDTTRHTQQLLSGKSGSSRILPKSKFNTHEVTHVRVKHGVLLKRKLQYTWTPWAVTWWTTPPLSSPSSVLPPHSSLSPFSRARKNSEFLLL